MTSPRTPSVTDALTVTDTPTILITYRIVNLAEALTVGHTPTVNLLSYVSLSDQTTVGEFRRIYSPVQISEEITITLPASTGYDLAISDAITVADIPSIFLPILTNESSDAVTVGDIGILNLLSYVDETEAVTVVDAATVNLLSFVDESELVTVSDAPLVNLLSFIDEAELVTVGDAPVVTVSDPQIAITEPVTVSDTPTISLPGVLALAVNVSDSCTVGEPRKIYSPVHVGEEVSLSVITNPPANVSATEAITVGHTATINLLSYISTIEELTVEEDHLAYNPIQVSEQVTIVIVSISTRTVDETELVTVGDVPLVNLLSYVDETEAVTVADSAVLNLLSVISVTDTVTCVDTPTINLLSYINVSDGTTVTDAPVLAVSAPQINITEPIEVDEISLISLPGITPYLIFIVEPIAVEDSVDVRVPIAEISETDPVSVTDTPSINLLSYITVTELTTVTDSPALQVRVSLDQEEPVFVTDTPAVNLRSFIDESESVLINTQVTIVIPGVTLQTNVVEIISMTDTISATSFWAVNVSDQIDVEEEGVAASIGGIQGINNPGAKSLTARRKVGTMSPKRRAVPTN